VFHQAFRSRTSSPPALEPLTLLSQVSYHHFHCIPALSFFTQNRCQILLIHVGAPMSLIGNANFRSLGIYTRFCSAVDENKLSLSTQRHFLPCTHTFHSMAQRVLLVVLSHPAGQHHVVLPRDGALKCESS
jgi:hypothetical protein